MVQLWQAWLLDRAGQKEEAEKKLILAMAASPELVFPFRTEMKGLFSWADKLKPDWKWRYFEALIYWQHNQYDKAKSLFNSCRTEPAFVPFYLAKAELFKDDCSVAGASLEKAYQLDPLFWRTGLKLTHYYVSEKQPEKAIAIAAENYKNHSSSFIIGLQYAQMLKLDRRYSEALSVLSRLEMLPAEGDVNAHSLFRETNILFAIEQMKTGKWKKALLYLQKAETWPENLFSGEPYLADNRMTHFLAAYCYEKLKNLSEAEKSFTYIVNYSNPDGWTSVLGNRLTAMAVGGERNYKTMAETMLEEKLNDKDNEILSLFLQLYQRL